MSIFEIAEKFAIKLAAGGYFRSDPKYDEKGNLLPIPEKIPEIEAPAPPKRRERRIIPYQPTEEELKPKGPWEPETYEELEPGEPYAVGPSGKTVVKAPSNLTDAEIDSLSEEDFNEWARQVGVIKDPIKEKNSAIETDILLSYIQAEAMRQEYTKIPDLIGVEIEGGDDKLFYYDELTQKLIPIKSRMQMKVLQSDLTKEFRRRANE